MAWVQGQVPSSRLHHWAKMAQFNNLEPARLAQRPKINAFVRVKLDARQALGTDSINSSITRRGPKTAGGKVGAQNDGRKGGGFKTAGGEIVAGGSGSGPEKPKTAGGKNLAGSGQTRRGPKTAGGKVGAQNGERKGGGSKRRAERVW